jgi:ABC-type multidrug transport system ATPase subunit
VVNRPRALRSSRGFGFVAQETPVYAALTVADHLRLGAWLNRDWDADQAKRRIDQLGLDPRRPDRR